MRLHLVVGLLLGLLGHAFAQAPPKEARFVATMDGGQTPLAFGRLVSTVDGAHWLVLSETAHGCAEPLGRTEASDAEVIVSFSDAAFTTASDEVFFAGKRGGHPATGAKIELTRSPDQRRATGRIDVPVKDGLGGSGTFDAEWCGSPVGPWGAPDLTAVPTTTVEMELDPGRKVLAHGRLFMSVNGKPRLVLEEDAHRCNETPSPVGHGLIVFFPDKTLKTPRRAAVSTPDQMMLTKLYAVEIVLGTGRRKRRVTGRIDIMPDQEQPYFRVRGTFDVERCTKPVKQ